ncbi:MAG: tetratricopeptide repeat protein [Myxococcota bacterium]|nr:tetratricopeptide repeat protein [Myxococcota bacterium]
MLSLLLIGCRSPVEEGRAALNVHDLAAAEGSFRAALERDAEDIAALDGLGWTYLLAGQREAAASAFDRCLELMPTSGDCLRGRASVATADDNLPLARSMLLKAQEFDPDNPGVIASLALHDMLAGRMTDAEERYRLLVTRFPEEAEYRLGLARVLMRLDRVEDALGLIEEALVLPDTPVRYRSMLWVLRAHGLVVRTAGLEDPERCAETAPAVLSWLDAAEQSLVQAESTGVTSPELARIRRLVKKRRGAVEEVCPAQVRGEPEEPMPPGRPPERADGSL